MDFKEILDIFEVAHVSQIGGEGSEALGSSSFSENAEYSSDQDVEDTDNPYYGNNFDAETAVDCTDDLEKINMKETSSDQLMRYHFPDRRVAFMFYNCYGRFHGFAGRKSRVVKNTNGEVVQQTFVCHREGIRNANNALSRKREQKPTSRCRCPAKLQVHLDLGSERWYIKLFDDIHNHSFLDEKYEGMLPAHRKMSDYDKYQMKTMRKVGIPTSGIYGFFATQAGGYENLGYSRREMYNENLDIRGSFFAGFRTTSRCEGLHSEFGKYVSVLSNLVDFLQHFFRWMNYMRYREIEADYAGSFGEIVLQTQHTTLERSASNLYTRSIFKLFRPMLERSCRCKVEGVMQSGSILTYIVYKYPRHDIQWSVLFCQEKLIFECSCKRFETLGIPCEHVICVLVYLNIVVLPECLVLERWTKCAKDAINASNANSSNHRNPAFITTYVTFVERCKRMVKAAFECGKLEHIRSTIEMVEKHTSVLEAMGRGESDDMHSLGLQTGRSVGNPPRYRKKGRAVASSSHTLNEKKKKRSSAKCGICGLTGHNRVSCKYRGESNAQSQTHSENNVNYVDDEFVEDNDDWNLSMDLS